MVVTRSGGQSAGPITRVAADASDPEPDDRTGDRSEGTVQLRQPRGLHHLGAGVAATGGESADGGGAHRRHLVITGNLYPYGPTEAPDGRGPARYAPSITRADSGRACGPRRSRAIGPGGSHAVEVRGSDYLGPGVGGNGHISRHVATARRGKAAQVIGRPDLPHTWTDVGDMARTLAAVADREDSWGQVWHAPSNEPRSQREALTDVLAAGGLPPVTVRGTPDWTLAVAGLFSPLVRELRETSYMFRRPYVMDSARTQEFLGLAPTPWDEVCRRTVEGN